MNASVHALLEGILDYAGLFPPAKLDMPSAASEYDHHRRGPLRWMLSRFLCPLARLEELRRHLHEPWPLGVLAAPADDPEALSASLDRELGLLGGLSAQVLEVPFPRGLLGSGNVGAFLGRTSDRLARDPAAPKVVFFELGFAGGWPETLRRVAGHLADHHGRGSPVRFGMKVRTGGADAAAVPDADRVAGFILTARDAGVPFKATAGLHRAVRGNGMHGFLNVFSAGVFMKYRKIQTEDLRDLLREDDPAAFRFDDEGLAWRAVHATVDQIRRARLAFAVSFGSCSFTEPWEHLHALGLLEQGPGA